MSVCLDLRAFSLNPTASLPDDLVILSALDRLELSSSDIRALVVSEESEVLISMEDAVELLKVGAKSASAHAHDCNRPREIVGELLTVMPSERYVEAAVVYQFDNWCVPSASSDERLVSSWRRITQKTKVSALFYGADPLTRPAEFLPSEVTKWSPYFRWISQLEEVVCISPKALADLESISNGAVKPGWVIL